MKTPSLIFTLLSLFLLTTLQAQDSKIIAAFEQSYTEEAAGKYTEAINTMKEVYDANSYEVNIRLGWLHYIGGLFTEAESYYQKSIKLRPMSIEARLGYVMPASALGNWDKVLNQYKEILKIDPNHSTVNYRIGMIYYGREDWDNAYKHFEKVANLYPFDYSGLLMYAWANYRKGKASEAKRLFNRVLMLSPNDASALEGLELLK